MNRFLKEINRNEVLKYLGYKGGAVDEKLENDIALCTKEVIDVSRVKVYWRLFDIEDNYRLNGTNFIPGGNDIKELLKSSKKAVMLAATIGSDIETLIRRYEVYDIYKALIIDSCASSAIENVCDNFQIELEKKMAEENLFITDRFSPGYGDMPFEQQKEICEILNTQRNIGVSLSSSGIMIPRKSVTAIIGVSETKQIKRFRGCEYCSMFENCSYRKGGTSCGRF